MEQLVKMLLEKRDKLLKIKQVIISDDTVNDYIINNGNLNIGYSNGSCQYYLRTEENKADFPKGKYLHKADMELARKIAQRDYNRKMLKETDKQLRLVERALMQLQDRKLEEIFTREGKARQKLLRPLVLPIEDYVKQWEAVIYEGKAFPDGQVEIYTEKGERVRSKSEKIIADKLYKKGVPYRYEFPYRLKGMGMVYSDFTCLRKWDRKEIIWEHFGMMTDPTYAKNAVRKIEMYEKNGYIPGKNIIYTFESAECPLNTLCTDKIIEEMFL